MCVRYMVVWTCAEVANCPPARVVKGVRLVQVVALCVVVSCCNSVVSCGGLAFRNTQVHSCFLSPHLSNDDCPFPLLHLYDHPTEDPTPVPLQQQHQHQHRLRWRHQYLVGTSAPGKGHFLGVEPPGRKTRLQGLAPGL